MKTLQEIRKEHIGRILKKTHWNLKKASEILDIPEDVLAREIKAAGLTPVKTPPKK